MSCNITLMYFSFTVFEQSIIFMFGEQCTNQKPISIEILDTFYLNFVGITEERMTTYF